MPGAALWILLLASLALVFPRILAAQAGPTGSLHGTVLDPSGGAVANASVQVIPSGGTTALSRRRSNATGGYNLNNVPAGNVHGAESLSAGFAAFERDMVAVGAGRATCSWTSR